ncbi:hypothetical protein ACIA98_03485 [Streptomyces sp. NPDC051366]|uniref:hypothetical protein n=1 Tax=Streptomyces sp. NPDC051366 TaxID=3365652 RepID=UPI0037AB0A6C
MTHPFRMRRMFVFAASTAAAAGAVLLPTGAFAATPATPHTVVAQGEPGPNPAHNDNNSTLLLVVPEDSDEGRIVVKPDVQEPQDNRAVNKADPGKIRVHDKAGRDGGLLDPPKDPVWICVAAPCGPPSNARTIVT